MNRCLSRINQFKLMFPGARMAIVQGPRVVGYVTTTEARKLISDGKAKVLAQAGGSSAALSISAGARNVHSRTKKGVRGNTCHYCGEKCPEGERTLDHKTPVVRRGKNSTENLVVSCARCNCEKGTMTEKEYRRYVERRGPL